jgi:hypothetical protein
MRKKVHGVLLGWTVGILLATSATCPTAEEKTMEIKGEEVHQGQAVLTVAESKRLIAKGIAKMPLVRKALREGTVIVTTGTTNTYIAEELLGRKIEHGVFVTGRVLPRKGGRKLQPQGEFLPVVVLRNGSPAEGVTLDQALEDLKPGDVVMKGANALNYAEKTAGVLIGHPSSGTIGKVMPYVVARRAHLVIPVGLEKQVSDSVREISRRMRQPVKNVGKIPSMFLMEGHIVTEIEALEHLTGVKAFQASAGGIGGAEGSVWLVFRGTQEQVEETIRIVEDVHGEPAFVR